MLSNRNNDNTINLRLTQSISISVNRLCSTDTSSQGIVELKNILLDCVDDMENFTIFINTLMQAPNNPILCKRECVKFYSIIAELSDYKLIEYNLLNKIVLYLLKQLKDNPNLMICISDVMGSLSLFICIKTKDLDDTIRIIGTLLKPCFSLLITPQKSVQQGAALSVSKIIFNCSAPEGLIASLPRLLSRILELISSQTCSCHSELLDALVSLIWRTRSNFSCHSLKVLPISYECLASSEDAVRRSAVDVIHALIVVCPEILNDYKSEIFNCLQHCRTDKSKLVRDSSMAAI